MKKFLLLSVAALGLTTAVKAQVQVAPDLKAEAAQVSVAPIADNATLQGEVGTPATGPKRSVANGVWYKRPSGTFLQTSSSYRQMLVPPFAPITCTNMYSDKSASAWKYGANNAYDLANNASIFKEMDNGNAVLSVTMNTGTGAWYGPVLTVEGVDTFAFLDSQNKGQNVIIVAPDTIKTFSNIPTSVQYTGFTDFVFGTNPPGTAERTTGNSETYVWDTFMEFMKAPATPLYLESLYLVALVGENSSEPIADGSEGVTAYLLQAPGTHTQGNLSGYTDTLAVIPINKTLSDITVNEFSDGSGHYAYIEAYCMEEDEFGDMVRKPVVVDKDFVIVFEGFNNDGVDFGLYMSAISSSQYPCPEEIAANGGAYPTLRRSYWTSDGALRGTYWNYNATSGVQYNMIVRLTGMFDVAHLYNDVTEYYAPADGGTVTDAENGGNTYIRLQSSFPYQAAEARTPNYTIDGLPDWLSVTAHSGEDYHSQSYGYSSTIVLTAQALPSGVEGRMATLRFTSEKGAKSEEFVVIQGDKDAAGINGITDNNEVKTALRGIYNLNGQQVGNDYKGVVIENGKKVIRK